MRKILTFFMLSVLFLALPQADAATIYNTFGPGDTFKSPGWTISNQSDSLPNLDQGDAFIPDASYSLDTIELAFSLIEGTNALDVWLMSDSGGEPGTIIETFQFINQMSSIPLRGIISGTSTLSPLLEAGTQYWLIASVPVSGTLAVWWMSPSVEGLHAYREDLGTWNVFNTNRSDTENQGAFRINGTPVPEPSTILLLGAGLAGVGILRRRFKN